MAKKTRTILKDPDSKLPYTWDWSTWLESGDSIISSTWAVESGLIQPYASGFDTTSTYIWISGGVAGETYRAVNHIVTANNLEEDATYIFQVEEEF